MSANSISELRFRSQMPDFDREVIPDTVPDVEWFTDPSDPTPVGLWRPGVAEWSRGGWAAYLASAPGECEWFDSLSMACWWLEEFHHVENIYIVEPPMPEPVRVALTTAEELPRVRLPQPFLTLVLLAGFALTVAPALMGMVL